MVALTDSTTPKRTTWSQYAAMPSMCVQEPLPSEATKSRWFRRSSILAVRPVVMPPCGGAAAQPLIRSLPEAKHPREAGMRSPPPIAVPRSPRGRCVAWDNHLVNRRCFRPDAPWFSRSNRSLPLRGTMNRLSPSPDSSTLRRRPESIPDGESNWRGLERNGCLARFRLGPGCSLSRFGPLRLHSLQNFDGIQCRCPAR
jgi:hypothetical protein